MPHLTFPTILLKLSLRDTNQLTKPQTLMKSLNATRPTPAATKYRVARQARFGRAPRVLPARATAKRPARVRSDIEKEFEANFTRIAHLQRFRAVRDAIEKLGDMSIRICRSYATFSDTSGNQFAVVKPLSDGGLRVGVGVYEGIDNTGLQPAAGLGGSSRINHQFEIAGYEVISGRQLGHLRKAYRDALESES